MLAWTKKKKSTDESVKDQGVVFFFFDWKGIVRYEFVPRGQLYQVV